MSYDLFVFDLDGTLVDSLADIAGALNYVLAAHGLGQLDEPVVRTLVGDGIVVLATRALARQDREARLDPVAFAAEIQAYYLAQPCVRSRLYDGISPLLDALDADRRHMAVLTNKPGDVARALLESLGVAGRFAAIIGDGDGWARKPSPDALRILASQRAVSLERTLMVGDGLPDLAVARAAPCASAAALWGYTPPERLQAERPTHAIASPQDLLALL